MFNLLQLFKKQNKSNFLEIILIFCSVQFLVLSACSASKEERRGIIKKQVETEEFLDSTKVAAKLEPINYPWNSEGYLTDLRRNKALVPPDSITKKYPNPFSPSTYIDFNNPVAESLKVFICNAGEISCLKVDEGFFEKGLYTLGFQKLDIKSNILTFKVCSTDTCYSKKIIILP